MPLFATPFWLSSMLPIHKTNTVLMLLYNRTVTEVEEKIREGKI